MSVGVRAEIILHTNWIRSYSGRGIETRYKIALEYHVRANICR